MMSLMEYEEFTKQLGAMGFQSVTTPEQYQRCHHLPGWYEQLKQYTPETHFFSENEDIAAALKAIGWSECFLKDYVKSLSTDGGSFVSSLDQLPLIIDKMRKYRGHIEGGICARKIVEIAPDTEQRYFVVNGKVYSAGDSTPAITQIASDCLFNSFFTIDIATLITGEPIIIELGDAQVSDRKEWDTTKFLGVLRALS